MASRVEIIERRRLVVGDREIDLAALVPEGGGPATQELEASPGGSAVDETVVLGTPQGVYRFTVARPKGGALTVEAKPLAPHAEVTRLHVEGATLHVEGTVPTEAEEPAYLFARRRGDAMEVVAPARRRRRALPRRPRPRRARAARATSATSGTCGSRSGAARYRLGTHLDGIPNRSEASEYPAAQVGGRRIQPYYTVENNVSVRSQTGRRAERAAPAEPLGEDAEPTLAPAAARAARDPRAPAGAAARARCAAGARSPTAATSASCSSTRGGWAAPCARP